MAALASHFRAGLMLLLATVAAAGCQHVPIADPTMAAPSVRLAVDLPRLRSVRPRSVDLWIARPRVNAGRPFVLHLTGDSGRHGLDLELFAALTRWGYPVAVLSAPDWISTLVNGATTPEALSRDLDVAAKAGARALEMDENAPYVVMGLSRGAGLAIEAAATLRPRLLGIVAIGLCPREERVRDKEGMGHPYREQLLLTDLPLEVIQSTHDHYLDAAEAREAFGPDTDLHAFHPIDARSHTFEGGREALLAQLEASLRRVAGR